MQLTQQDITRLWAGVKRGLPTECWEWQRALSANGGYGIINLGGKATRAHRVVYFLTQGDLNTTLEILHTCDNKKCCNPAHLTQDTHRANLIQAGKAGTMARHVGVNSKLGLSEETLKAIVLSTASLREIGRQHGIYHKTVAQIKREFSLCQK